MTMTGNKSNKDEMLIGDHVSFDSEGLNLDGLEGVQVAELAGEMKADNGDFAIVDVGGELGLIAVNWSRLTKV